MSSSSGTPGRPGEQHVDDFLEIEQPERQFQIARIENQRAVAEAAAIFVMHVEAGKPEGSGRGLQDFIEQQ